MSGYLFLHGFSDDAAARIRQLAGLMNDLELQVNRVEAWRSYRTKTFAPALGSPLQRDDEQMPLGSISLPARIAAHAALEHLDAAAKLWREEQFASPAAWSSLCRPALMNAAQVIWMLAPQDQQTRITRALMTAVDECLQEKRHVADVTKYAFLGPDDLRDAEEHARELADMEGQLRSALIARGCTRPNLNATGMVQWAVEHLYPGDQVKQYAHMFMWRVGSGAAHGKVWPIVLLADRRRGFEDHIEARHALEPAHLHAFFKAPTEMLQAAFDLLIAQSTADSSTAG